MPGGQEARRGVVVVGHAEVVEERIHYCFMKLLLDKRERDRREVY